MSRRSFLAASGLASLALLGGCGSGSAGSAQGSGAASGQASGGSAASAAASAASSAAAGAPIVVGTLATEDILPLWVAQEENLFDGSDVSANIVEFQSATELIAGVASGEVDMAMTDIMVTASLFASGVDVRMEWVTLGSTPDQGRFGIMVGPNSTVGSLADLAGVPIGVGSNTILEYVMDKLMEAAGVPSDQVKVEELQKLPVRYQAMASGDVAAAALPGTLLALGEANGCKLVADDTSGENLSQSVMIARTDRVSDAAFKQRLDALKAIWNTAAGMVNTSPETYRPVLVQHANLPEQIASTYPISTYPTTQLPTAAMVEPVLSWMQQKGYLTQPLRYDENLGEFHTA